MADIGLREKMLVKDIMSSPVVTIKETAKVNRLAKVMAKNNFGCVVITSLDEKPIGIITERDLVIRVLAENILPDSVTAKDVMTSPLITIDPDETISDAARKMSRLNIRRLGVVYKGHLTGLLSSNDIIAVMPELLEIIKERAIIESENAAQVSQEESPTLAGYCDSCRSWSDHLIEVNGEYLCEDCKSEYKVNE